MGTRLANIDLITLTFLDTVFPLRFALMWVIMMCSNSFYALIVVMLQWSALSGVGAFWKNGQLDLLCIYCCHTVANRKQKVLGKRKIIH